MSMIKLIALEKVIIMTSDWVKNLLEQNPDLTLPIIVNSGKEVFKELNSKWDAFLTLLSSEKELESCIEPVEFSIKKSTRQRTFIILEILVRPASVCMR